MPMLECTLLTERDNEQPLLLNLLEKPCQKQGNTCETQKIGDLEALLRLVIKTPKPGGVGGEATPPPSPPPKKKGGCRGAGV